jgi:hypothetical protein
MRATVLAVRERLDASRGSLPEKADRPTLLTSDPGERPIAVLALTSRATGKVGEGGVDLRTLARTAADGVVRASAQQQIISVVRQLEPLFTGTNATCLGSHPMAGSEKKGLAHAEAGLFEGAAVVLTPEEGDLPHLPRLEHFWKTLGGIVTRLAPDRHDDLVAGISHLPHLVAAALARSVLSWEPGAVTLSGGGFRDTTRVAGGPEEMWADILSDNREAVSRRLAAYLDELQTWKDALDALDRDRLRDLLCEARRLRGTVPARTPSPSPDPAT